MDATLIIIVFFTGFAVILVLYMFRDTLKRFALRFREFEGEMELEPRPLPQNKSEESEVTQISEKTVQGDEKNSTSASSGLADIEDNTILGSKVKSRGKGIGLRRLLVWRSDIDISTNEGTDSDGE